MLLSQGLLLGVVSVFGFLGWARAADDGQQCHGIDECGGQELHNVWIKEGVTPCEKVFGSDSFACSCSGDSCDFLGDLPHPDDSTTFTVVTSDRSEKRFAVTQGRAEKVQRDGSTLVLMNPSLQYQEMVGFGGGFTDAAGINIMSLSATTRDTLIRSYFSPEGLRYSMGRVPIAGTDFSTRTYSYDDVEGDVDLKHFALAEDDLKYKLPVIALARAAQGPSSQELFLLATPWSPPAWMKTNGKFNGTGGLLPEMREAYANYIAKFVNAYADRGEKLWGLTPQNEPLCGTLQDWPFNACLWYAPDMKDWIKQHLAPSLHAAGHRDLKIIVSDQVRMFLLPYVTEILSDDTARALVSGIGVHWYMDDVANLETLDRVHGLFPDQFLLYTEACEGFESPEDERVLMGDWGRAERYASSIIETSNHFSVGWLDWNLAVDVQGGPNWSNNFVDAPIIVDAGKDTFYKQPMFYALGHFSKFVERGAALVYNSQMQPTEGGLMAATFTMEDGRAVAVLLNKADTPQHVSLKPGSSSELYYHFEMPAKSIQTLLFRVF